MLIHCRDRTQNSRNFKVLLESNLHVFSIWGLLHFMRHECPTWLHTLLYSVSACFQNHVPYALICQPATVPPSTFHIPYSHMEMSPREYSVVGNSVIYRDAFGKQIVKLQITLLAFSLPIGLLQTSTFPVLSLDLFNSYIRYLVLYILGRRLALAPAVVFPTVYSPAVRCVLLDYTCLFTVCFHKILSFRIFLTTSSLVTLSIHLTYIICSASVVLQSSVFHMFSGPAFRIPIMRHTNVRLYRA